MKYDKDKSQIIKGKNFIAGITQNKMPYVRCGHLYKSLKLKSPDNITGGGLYMCCMNLSFYSYRLNFGEQSYEEGRWKLRFLGST